jgi:site-specific DNA-methyltransferase (adenine-specific)
MNPPYGRAIGHWVAKLCVEYRAGRVTTAIALLPARTDTRWWRDVADFPICFVSGRLRFSGHPNSAPFPSALVYLGDDWAGFVRTFRDIGIISYRVG